MLTNGTILTNHNEITKFQQSDLSELWYCDLGHKPDVTGCFDRAVGIIL